MPSWVLKLFIYKQTTELLRIAELFDGNLLASSVLDAFQTGTSKVLSNHKRLFHLICDLQYQYLKYLKSLSFLLGACVACQLGFTILVPSNIYQVQAKAKSLAWAINHLCHIRFSYPVHIRVHKLYSLLVL